jgi:hypothetical protein
MRLFVLIQKRIYDPKATCLRQKEYIGGGSFTKKKLKY